MVSNTATSDVTGLGAGGEVTAAGAEGVGREGVGCVTTVCGPDSGGVVAVTEVAAAGTGFVCAGAAVAGEDESAWGAADVVDETGGIDGIATDVPGEAADRDVPLIRGVDAGVVADDATDVDGAGLGVLAGGVCSTDSPGVDDGAVVVDDVPGVELIAGVASESVAGDAWVADPSLEEVAGTVSADAVPCPVAHAPTMAIAPPAIFAARTQSLLTLMNSPSHMATVMGTDTV